MLAVICLFTLWGCEEPDITPPDDHLAPDKTFVFKELSITLTEAFEIVEEDRNKIWYDPTSKDISVSIVAEKIPTVQNTPVGLEEFASDFFAKGPYKPKSEISSKNGFFFAECEIKNFGFDFLYYIAIYESESIYYVSYFMCDLKDYETYKPYIEKWSESVIITPLSTK